MTKKKPARLVEHELCICGHIKLNHHGFNDILNGYYPSGCTASLGNGSSCLCWAYQMDNLAYLEEKAYENE